MIYMYMDPVGDDRDGYTFSSSVAFHLKHGDQVRVGGCSPAENIWKESEANHFTGLLVKPDV